VNFNLFVTNRRLESKVHDTSHFFRVEEFHPFRIH